MRHSDAGAPVRVDEGLFVAIHGVAQWITLRGNDRRNPALLILSGPGVAFSRLAPLFALWEADFTLVQWDQPGAGATFARNGEAGTGALSLARLARDAAAVIEVVRARLGARKLNVLGISGGSVVGLTLARERPDLVAAYVGTGQFTHHGRQDALSYDLVLEQARVEGNNAALTELEALGPPPWPDAFSDAVVSKHAGALTPAEQAAFTPAVMAAIASPPEDAAYIARGLPEADQRTQGLAAYAALRDDLKAFDAARLGAAFDTPVLFIQGAEDRYSVTSEVETYAKTLRTPRKAFVTLDGGGHSCVFMADFRVALKNVLAEEK